MKFYDYMTEFIFVEHQPEKADIIFVPGGNYPDSARYAAQLYKEGWAPYVMPSGKYSIVTGKFVLAEQMQDAGHSEKRSDCQNADCQRVNDQKPKGNDEKSDLSDEVYETEWDYLKGILIQNGVPSEAVLKENEATYTYENAIYSRKKLDEMGIIVKKAILCCQAFHARRCLLYYQEQFPETEFMVCPVVTKGISRENWYQTEYGIQTVLGEIERCGAQFHEIMKRNAGLI